MKRNKVSLYLVWILFFLSYASTADELLGMLGWGLSAEKDSFYPGEPVRLILQVDNKGIRDETLFLGNEGIEYVSMEIHDPNDRVICIGAPVLRNGLSKSGLLSVPSGKISQKALILNRWCSTLLPPGNYQVICRLKYLLLSEAARRPHEEFYTAGPFHSVSFSVPLRITEMDTEAFRKILQDLAANEKSERFSDRDTWLAARETAREMIALAESELAVPYQMELLSVEPYTHRKKDILRSLVRSQSSMAAAGLCRLWEEKSSKHEDIRHDLLDAIQELRKTGKPEILEAIKTFPEQTK